MDKATIGTLPAIIAKARAKQEADMAQAKSQAERVAVRSEYERAVREAVQQAYGLPAFLLTRAGRPNA